MPEPTNITRAFVVETVKRLVEECGEDYTYVRAEIGPASCLYVHTDKTHYGVTGPVPGCIAGQVLHAAGIALHELAEREGLRAGTVVHDLRNAGRLTVEPGVYEMLNDMQEAQDDGETWAVALEIIEKYSAWKD